MQIEQKQNCFLMLCAQLIVYTKYSCIFSENPTHFRRGLQYAAIEALKLSHGGISYIAKLFGCSRDTIRAGIKELGQEDDLPGNRNRKAGGGRKSALASHEAIDELFLAILQDHTAGDPMNEPVKWTNLSVEAIKQRLKKAGITVSRNLVRKLLKKHD
jgi:transposase